jgi:transcriptional regulator with XRE-family HTH domain
LEGWHLSIRNAVASRILRLCEENNLAVNALARLSVVPPSTLKNIINGGSKNPGIVTIKMICDGLGITLAEFFTGKEFDELEQEIR